MSAQAGGRHWFNLDGVTPKTDPTEQQKDYFMRTYGASMAEVLGAAKSVCNEGDLQQVRLMKLSLEKILEAMADYLERQGAQ